ncbi:unnamed protein product [Owenia fusiformis]|uniref:Uncharacterized protein n=1 Tax=Owenia fusiformis TaxID=6347 RepID=A0A8J1YBQ7_OWEFU|nr:unnamed protein product [Owenia fusiformis]
MVQVKCMKHLTLLKCCFVSLIVLIVVFNFPVARSILIRFRKWNINLQRPRGIVNVLPYLDNEIPGNESSIKKDTVKNRTILTGWKGASQIYTNTSTVASEHLECTGDVTLASVDLRIIVLTQKRTKSLKVCLKHINNAEYHGQKVVLDIWIDREKNTEALNEEHIEMVKNFTFKSHIIKCVHIQDKHVGIYGQWIDTWKLGPNNKEIGVILEDDIDVSPHFYTWLKHVHLKYQNREDVSGVGLSTIYPNPIADKKSCLYRMKATGQSPNKCNTIQVPPKNNSVYMYRIPTTWGFSPKISSWRKFQKWYHDIRRSNKTFRPIIDAKIIHNTWYNKVKDMWSMWHIFHCHTNKLYCIFPNIANNGKFANHRQEKGLHYFVEKKVISHSPSLVREWDDRYLDLPDKLVHVGYDGSFSTES